jgi:hypothetical protein
LSRDNWFTKTFAKVVHQKGFDKKQMIKFVANGLGFFVIHFPAAFPKLFTKGFSFASGLKSNCLL